MAIQIELRVKKIGKSLGVIFPKEIVEKYDIKVGQVVRIGFEERNGKEVMVAKLV